MYGKTEMQQAVYNKAESSSAASKEPVSTHTVPQSTHKVNKSIFQQKMNFLEINLSLKYFFITCLFHCPF